MRRVFLGFSIFMLICAAPIFATHVDLYPNLAIIKDKWDVDIPAGQIVNINWTFPENVDEGSFTILDRECDVLSRIEALGRGSLVGQNVTVWTVNNAYRGIVKNEGQEIVLIDPKTGETVAIVRATQVVAIVPENETLAQDSLMLEVKNAGEYDLEELNVRYFASGITWGVNYVLQIDGNEGLLSGEYKIDNNTSMELKDATLRLIAQSDVPYVLKSREAMLFGSADLQAATLPSMDHQAETAVYSLPQKVTIPKNSRLRLMLLKESGLMVERAYQMNGNAVNVELTVEGITQALPKGEMQVFDGDILVASLHFKEKPKSGKINVNLGQTLDIAAKREQVKYVLQDGQHVSDYLVTLNNNKKQSEVIEVLISLPRENAEVLTEEGLEVKRLSGYSAAIKVLVGAQKERVLEYSIRYPEDK